MIFALFISCAEAARRVSRRQDERLSRSAHLGLLIHLATCQFCRRFNRQTRFIRSVFQHFHTHVEEASSLGLSTEAKDRIIARLQEQD